MYQGLSGSVCPVSSRCKKKKNKADRDFLIATYNKKSIGRHVQCSIVFLKGVGGGGQIHPQKKGILRGAQHRVLITSYNIKILLLYFLSFNSNFLHVPKKRGGGLTFYFLKSLLREKVGG